MWLELQEACVKRLEVFPIEPEAFMAIAAIPEATKTAGTTNMDLNSSLAIWCGMPTAGI